ncbi:MULTISPECIES: RNA polymerase sigma-70 factor [Bacteroides]|uniref:RNA polymerase sigma-70 factor n=1 Tax=Bacteroides TaxID=816 RepID=UPI0004B6918D|nr:RNA polymerase sigma-70 factor [Bacteroides neonati]
MNTTDDILLLKLIQSGDEHAFKYLFDTYFASLCRFMNVYLNDRQESEELALDIFLYVWEHRQEMEVKISLKAYLFRAARNKCLNCLRDRKTSLSLDEVNDHGQMIIDSSSLEMEELTRLIEEAICSLPDRCQEVFRKSREENLSNQHIANEMQISVKTVEGQITKALKRIKDFLGEQYTYLF